MGLPGGNLFYIGLFRENITEIFSENIRPRALIYKAKKCLVPRDHMLYTVLYREI